MSISSERFTRREMLRRAGCGFGYVALASLLADTARTATAAEANPLSPKAPHFKPRAKRVIFLFMHGGPSQVDTFDPKPLLVRDNGKLWKNSMPGDLIAPTSKLLASPWEFQKH